jgi:hypothetical protein
VIRVYLLEQKLKAPVAHFARSASVKTGGATIHSLSLAAPGSAFGIE